MLIAPFRKPVYAVPPAIMVGTEKRSLSIIKEARPGRQPRLLYTPVIFTISFNYLQEAVTMKVLKIVYPEREAIYKIALNSRFKQPARDYWLQHQPQGWAILLGRELNQLLADAILTAISLREFAARPSQKKQPSWNRKTR